MAPVEGDDVKVAGDEIEAGGLGLLHGDAARAVVADHRRARDDVDLGQHAVEQLDLEAQARVGEGDREGLGAVGLVLGVGGGKARQAVLAGTDLVADVAQVAAEGAVGAADHEQRAPHVARALEGVLLGQDVERVGAVGHVVRAAAHAAAVGIGDEVGQVALGAGAVVEVEEVAVLVHLHLVGGCCGVDGEGARGGVVLN